MDDEKLEKPFGVKRMGVDKARRGARQKGLRNVAWGWVELSQVTASKGPTWRHRNSHILSLKKETHFLLSITQN